MESRSIASLAAGLALAALSVAAPAVAQGPAVGLGAGLASLPRVFVPSCGNRAGQVPGAGAGLQAMVPVSGRLGVEARLGVYAPYDHQLCALMIAPVPDGIWTRSVYPSGDGSVVATDLRLAYLPSPDFTVSAGAGWLWSPHAPYLALGPRFRTPGGSAHFVADLDWLLGWFPHDLVTSEWRSNLIVRDVSRSTVHEWRSIVAVRVGFQLDVR